jgi:4-diphosphocytidyl-2-C-methyl-D-erythritol kinase
MFVTVRSFAKINLGLRIGALRPDGFHDLRTVYQTIALHDVVRVEVGRGSGIEIRCADPRVPKDESNTCCRIVERAMAALRARGRVIVEIEKRLPVQGGLGGASSNAVAALLALERAVKKSLSGAEGLRIAAEVGSDLPLFLVGGTVLGAGRGEEVYPLPDLPATPCVIATPNIGVSTPKAFADWDALVAAVQRADSSADPPPLGMTSPRSVSNLTIADPSDRITKFGRVITAWLSGSQTKSGKFYSGVPASGRGRAETPLLDLVRTGIENDFEQVVFPQYPELREVKRVLERAEAFYASLSGSGSATYGLFGSREGAEKAAAKLRKDGIPALATATLTRPQYWKKFPVSGF